MTTVKACANIERLMNLLQTHGFVHVDHNTPQSGAIQYIFGHAGALLRRNILQEWWLSMVVKQKSAYVTERIPAVTSPGRLDEHEELDHQTNLYKAGLGQYLQNLELNGGYVPFSIVQVSDGVNQVSDHDVAFTRNTRTTKLFSQHFIAPSAATQFFDQLLHTRLNWWRQYSHLGSRFSSSDVELNPDGSSAVRVHYDAPWGQVGVERLMNHGNAHLKSMELSSSQPHTARDGRKSVLPMVISCEASLEHGMLALLTDAHQTHPSSSNALVGNDEQGQRDVLSLHHRLAPYKVSLAMSKFLTSGKDLREVADYVANELRAAMIPVLDPPDNSTLESRYSLFDQLGVPFTVVFRDSTVNDGFVYIRSRDTTLMEKVHVTHLRKTIVRALRSW